MPPPIVEVTVFVLDVGFTVSRKEKEDVQSFFQNAQTCIVRIIERKIFSRPSDLIGLILMGTEQTNNNFTHINSDFKHISVATELQCPSWNLIELIKDEIKTTKFNSDWMSALKIAIDFLQNNVDVKKVAQRKIVLMTDLKTCPNNSDKKLQELIDEFKTNDIELIVIGPDIWMDDESEPTNIINKAKEHQNSELILKNIISELESIACSFEDAIYQLLYYKRRATNPYPWNVDLSIGPDITIPVSAYPRIRDDKTIGSWKKVYKDPISKKSSTTETLKTTKTYYEKDNNTAMVDELDIVNGYLYGGKIIPFTKLDKQMEYKSGAKCLTVFGFTEKANIDWNNLTGDGLSYVVSRKGDENAKIALDAFITSLENLESVAIVRKVYANNTAPHMNVLFPIIEKNHKYLSMIALAYKEDYRNMLFPSINKKQYEYNEEQSKCIDDLIDSMNLSEIGEDGKELFTVEGSVNPIIQYTFDVIAHRALYPNDPLPLPRPEVQKLLEVPQIITKLATGPMEEIKKKFDLVVNEKKKTKQFWINKKLKAENEPSIQITESTKDESSGSISLSMMTQITNIGTANPIKDFTYLLNSGEPFKELSEQMKDIIERLIFFTYSTNYSKPIEALTLLRNECLINDPEIYNSWILNLKAACLQRNRKDFFPLIVDNKLGLITESENSVSSVKEDDVVKFLNIPEDDVLFNDDDEIDMSNLEFLD